MPLRLLAVFQQRWVVSKAIGFHHFPNNKAGANKRAGFIDAPDINAKKNMSRSTIPPITNPPKPLKPFVYTTTNITAVSRAEANIYTPNIKGKGYA